MERGFCQPQKKADLGQIWLKDYFLNKYPDSGPSFYFIFTTEVHFWEKAAVIIMIL